MTLLPVPFQFPQAVLAKHIGILGMTGAGKTSTTKLLVEQVVAGGARVCILDPIKSDHWGLTSSADGTQPGLPFHILGGPRGHLPLHEGAGKAIGELVATGALPLSILDMADFGPGGQQRFFADFAPALLRKMKGVLYLVMEEAHLFAPKERAGMSAENMSIHWAKTLATAGRSKGIRLIPATQRVQSLHNALLSSCNTLIAHQLTYPADQKPVVDWLKANAPKGTAHDVAGSLAQLQTGQGWFCSAAAHTFELIQFPRITTFDNSATPTEDAAEIDVKTVAVDLAGLQALIGDAVKDAEDSDPKRLRTRIADLERKLKNNEAVATDGLFSEEQVRERIKAAVQPYEKSIEEARDAYVGMVDAVSDLRDKMDDVLQFNPRHAIGEVEAPASARPSPPSLPPLRAKQCPPRVAARNKVSVAASPTVRRILDAIHRSHPVALTFAAAAQRAAVSKRSSAYGSYEKQVQASGEVITRADGRLTSAPGFAAPPGPGVNPIDEFKKKLTPSWASILNVIAEADGKPLTKSQVSDRSGVSPTSSGLSAGLNELIALGLVVLVDDKYALSPDLVGVASGQNH